MRLCFKRRSLWVTGIFMGLLFSGPMLTAGEEIIYEGELNSIVLSVKTTAYVKVLRNDNGRDYIELHDYKFKGGVVRDLKICGDIDSGYPFEGICVSNAGEPPLKAKKYRVMVSSTAFINYEKVVIFDLDLAETQALAKLYPVEDINRNGIADYREETLTE